MGCSPVAVHRAGPWVGRHVRNLCHRERGSHARQHAPLHAHERVRICSHARSLQWELTVALCTAQRWTFAATASLIRLRRRSTCACRQVRPAVCECSKRTRNTGHHLYGRLERPSPPLLTGVCRDGASSRGAAARAEKRPRDGQPHSRDL
jgi:hypothetical protein